MAEGTLECFLKVAELSICSVSQSRHSCPGVSTPGDHSGVGHPCGRVIPELCLQDPTLEFSVFPLTCQGFLTRLFPAYLALSAEHVLEGHGSWSWTDFQDSRESSFLQSQLHSPGLAGSSVPTACHKVSPLLGCVSCVCPLFLLLPLVTHACYPGFPLTVCLANSVAGSSWSVAFPGLWFWT